MDALSVVRRFYEEIWNAGRLEAIPTICDEDFTFRGSLGETKRGHAGFTEYVRSVRDPLTDYRCDIEEAVVQGDRVFARMRFGGIHEGSFLGYAPTGREIAWAGAALFTVREGRVRDLWVLGDLQGLRDQLEAHERA